MRTYEAIAASLAASGVDTVFGVVGEGNIALATSLARDHGVRYVAARREDGAVTMADGFARASGEVGVATVTHGPGLTNAVTALAETTRARTPLVLLAGATALTDRTNRQSIDQRRLAEAAGAEVIDVTAAEDAVTDLVDGLRRATVGRTPVVINLPTDLQQTRHGAVRVWKRIPVHRVQPDPAGVAAAAKLLARARRPVLLAGRGAVLADARAELDVLAGLTGAAVCTTLFAKGYFDGHPADLGVCGGFSTDIAERVIAEADCIVSFGASLNRWTTGKGRLFRGAVIQCDVDAAAVGRWYEADCAIVGDAAMTAAALGDALGAAERPDARDRLSTLAAALQRYDRASEFADRSGPAGLDLHPVTVALDGCLPADRTVVVDVGHFMSVPGRYLHVPDGTSFVSPSSFGSIGLAIAAAVGCSLAKPDRLTTCFLGDGGLMMSLQELDTAVRYDLAMLVVVMNDGAYGAEVHLCRNQGVPEDLAWLGPVDAAAIGGSMGMATRTVSTMAEVEPAVTELLEAGGPALLDVRINGEITTKYYRDAMATAARRG